MNLQQVASDSLTSKVVLAVIAAALGFVSALFVDQLKARREPRHQLSWDAHFDPGTIAVRSDIRDKVSILYKEERISSLAVLQCKVINTGNRVVKKEQVRFSFGQVRLLEAYLDPVPEPELHVEEIGDGGSAVNQKLYMIGHLERQQEVTFSFVLDGQPSRAWTPHPFNAEGDVAFVRRDISRIKEDEEHLQPFLVYLLLLFLIPPLIAAFLNFGGLTYSAVGLILLLLLAPHIGPACRMIARALTSLASQGPSNQGAIEVKSQGALANIILAHGSQIYGGVEVDVPSEVEVDGGQTSLEEAAPLEANERQIQG